MKDDQVRFWRELLAPFPPEALSEKPGRGGKPMTWLDKRSLYNRLDEVCGPHGWDIEFTPTARGYKARIGIDCPLADGTWKRFYKEDGGGHEEMDAVDDDDKSGYTNAARRAAQDAWGIGRYLYRKGIPNFLDPNAMPHSTAEPAPAPAPPKPTTPPPQEQPRRFELGFIPEAGRGVYPWIKDVEKHFHDQLWAGVRGEAESKGFPLAALEWNHDQVQVLLSNLIRYIKSQPYYKGEFDAVALLSEGFSKPEPAPAPAGSLKVPKAQLGRTVAAIVEKRLGKPGGKGDIIAVLTSIAANAADEKGRTGETLQSLMLCEDATWVTNMVKLAEDELSKIMIASPAAGDDDIPF